MQRVLDGENRCEVLRLNDDEQRTFDGLRENFKVEIRLDAKALLWNVSASVGTCL